ncbi:Flp pilus assembly protein CpaB [Hydrocarboniphaga effusa]|nr:Flp pilus assembly protein CpaB [Hydrocarboniphaga effusa]
MSSSAAKVVAIIAVILTAALAFAGYRLSREYAQTNQPATAKAVPGAAGTTAQPAIPKTLAVAALKPLAAYQPITKEDVTLVEFAVAPTDYYANVNDVIGKQPIIDIDGGAPLTKRYFGQGNILARAIPPGHQAISVEVNDVVAVGGFIRPGDTVDVLLYLRNGQDVEPQSRVLLRNVRVLAYDDALVERPEGLNEDEKKGTSSANSRNNSSAARRTRTAVLAVPELETTRLMLGASQGELRLALYGQRPPGTEDVAAPETVVAGGLPANDKTLATIESNKVPDKALSLEQLARIKPPPSKRSSAPVQVPVYRADKVETVSVRP